MSEYVPNVDEVRDSYASSGDGLDFKRRFFERFEEFDRWLAAELRKAKAEAWDEGRKAQRDWGAQTASCLIRWPAPVEPPREPVNPYQDKEN